MAKKVNEYEKYVPMRISLGRGYYTKEKWIALNKPSYTH